MNLPLLVSSYLLANVLIWGWADLIGRRITAARDFRVELAKTVGELMLADIARGDTARATERLYLMWRVPYSAMVYMFWKKFDSFYPYELFEA